MHGYDLRRRLRDDFGDFSHLSFGSLYPALARLERSGAVRAVSVAEAHRSDLPIAAALTGSLSGERAATIARRATAKAALALGGRGTRARKVYEITDKGDELFASLLAVPNSHEGDPKGFSLRLAFAQHLAPSERVELLEQRRRELVEVASRTARTLAAHQGELDRYRRVLAEHAKASVDTEIDWIESLIAAERDDALGTPRANDVKGTRAPEPARAAGASVTNGGVAR